jgi:uncharacterized phage infection (PIP) family protein YhgE
LIMHLDVLWPAEPFARSVVVALLAGFGIWMLSLFGTAIRMLRESDRLTVLSKDFSGVERAHRYVDDALDVVRIAGANGESLDLDALLRRTWRQIAAPEITLRAGLSLFIIVGLLGTLVGIALSLGQLSIATDTSTLNNDQVQGMQALFSELKGAFAPSIFGIGLTILGVILFALHSRSFATPLRTQLEEVAYENWLPFYQPTPEQHAHRAVSEAQKTTIASLELAEKIASHAALIESHSQGFVPQIAALTEATSSLVGTLRKLDASSRRFETGVSVSLDHHERLLYAVERYVGNEENTHALVAGISEQVAGLQALQERQTDVIDQLKIVESVYVDGQVETRAELRAIAEEARSAYSAMQGRDQFMAETITKGVSEVFDATRLTLVDISNELSTGLESSRIGINQDLSRVTESLSRIANPIEASALQIQGIAQTFAEHTDRSFKEIVKNLEQQAQMQGQRNREAEELGAMLKKNNQELRALADSIRQLAHSGALVPNPGWWSRMRKILRLSRNGKNGVPA